jgi:hypothetical protein
MFMNTIADIFLYMPFFGLFALIFRYEVYKSERRPFTCLGKENTKIIDRQKMFQEIITRLLCFAIAGVNRILLGPLPAFG